jgi:copper transport protein
VLFGLALQPGRVRARVDDVAWPIAVGIAFTFSATGHARTTDPSWISLASDTAHLSAMAVWLGGLVLLVGAVLPRREPDELADVLPVFSRAAFTAVCVLAVTGTYAAWRGVGSWRALFATEYGLLVVVKVVLFCGLLALGNMSRRVVQRRYQRSRPGRPVVAYAMTDAVEEVPDSDEADVERLRRSVLVEVVLAVAVLVATAVLVGQPRGTEALAAADRAPVTASTALGSGSSASVTVDPGQHGTVDVAITLSGGPRPTSVTATATQPDRQLGPIPLRLIADGAHGYSASGVTLPVSGNWVIALVITRSTFDAVTTQVTVHLS